MQRSQRSNGQHLLDHEEIKEFLKSIYFCFIDYAKAFDCVDHNNKSLWKILKEMGIPDHLHCLLRNLYAVKKQQLKSYMLGFHIIRTKSFQTSKLGLEKAEEPEIKLPAFTGS